MTGPINRTRPSEPATVNTLERFMGHLIKRDSEGGFYWTRPDGVSRAFRTVEDCRTDIGNYVGEHGQTDAIADDTEDEAA